MKGRELKPCPFCGGEVLFENNFARYNVTHHGECEKCGMVFEYTEKHEELSVDYPLLGEKRIYYNIMKQMNASFEEAWNRRADNEQRETD